MKITLTKATFYFNDPINLTPYARTLTVALDSLEDSVVRKLNLGVVTGVVEIVEGAKEFKARVESLTASKEQPKEDVPTEPEKPEVEETKVEPEVTDEVVEEKVETKEVETPKRKTTPVKKTAAKKA